MRQRKQQLSMHKYFTVLIIISTVINLVGSCIPGILYLDSIGTMLAAGLGGYIPGIIVGLITNLLKCINDPTSIYYASLNILIAVATAFIYKQEAKQIWKILFTVIITAFIGGVVGSILTDLIYGFDGTTLLPQIRQAYATGKLTGIQAQILNGALIDLADKALSVMPVYIAFNILPKRQLTYWQQRPLSEEERKKNKGKVRRKSIKTKVLVCMLGSMLLLSTVSIAISLTIFQKTHIDDYKKLGTSIAKIAADAMDGRQVDMYVQYPENPHTREIKKRMENILHCTDDLQYLYVYQIQEDGCHVVFDIDTDESEGASPGTIIPFDASFAECIPALLAGERIDPIITNDTYGQCHLVKAG